MKAKSMLLGLLGLAALAIAGNASATPYWAFACAGCDSTQMLAMAQANVGKGVIDWTTGIAVVYVYDPAIGTLYQYGMKQSPTTGLQVAYYIGPAPSNIQTTYKDIQTAVAQNNNNSVFVINEDTKGVTFPDRDRNLNAYSIASTSQAQNDILDWINNTYNNSNAAGIAGYLYTLTIAHSPLVVKFIIHLNDNSKVTFQFTDGEVTFASAVDANNNTIPLTITQAPGNYNFGNGGSIYSFYAYMQQQYGFKMNPNSPMICNGYTVACTTVGNTRYCNIVSCL